MNWDNAKDLIVHLSELRLNELKSWCSENNIKKSRNGNTNKLILRLNIFEYLMKRKISQEEHHLFCCANK